MLMRFFLRIVFAGSICVVTSSAQAQPRSNETQRNQPTSIIEDLRKMKAAAKNNDYESRKFFSVKKVISRKQKKLLSPDKSFSTIYADFLRQPDTGLIRLFQDVGCETNDNLIRVSEECLDWIPMSSSYSFREKEHTRDFLSDIKLRNDLLTAGDHLEQGILVALGNIELEKITLETEGINFLKDYNPEVESQKVLAQTLQLSKGVKSNGYLYKSSLPALQNVTYILRAIAYRGKLMSSFQGQKIDVLDGDNRSDLILAFRVLEKDSVGTLTIIWKRMARKSAPKIIFPK